MAVIKLQDSWSRTLRRISHVLPSVALSYSNTHSTVSLDEDLGEFIETGIEGPISIMDRIAFVEFLDNNKVLKPFIENALGASMYGRTDISNSSEIINYMFTWAETLEGFKYWQDLHDAGKNEVAR